MRETYNKDTYSVEHQELISTDCQNSLKPYKDREIK
jgi:hypothetical protein